MLIDSACMHEAVTRQGNENSLLNVDSMKKLKSFEGMSYKLNSLFMMRRAMMTANRIVINEVVTVI